MQIDYEQAARVQAHAHTTAPHPTHPESLDRQDIRGSLEFNKHVALETHLWGKVAPAQRLKTDRVRVRIRLAGVGELCV